MQEIVEKAKKYVYDNGTDLQKACLDYVMGIGDRQKLIEKFSAFQNPDGGWAHGLEIEYPGAASSPYTTAAALGYILKFDLEDSDLFRDTLKYIKNTQLENGMWDDPEEMLQYPHPPYMGPGIYLEYKTGMIVKGLIRLNVREKEMIDRALAFLTDSFDEISKKNDFWSAVAYSGAFSMLPHLKDYSRIMEWSMKVLMPKDADFGWQQAMGMIEDDIPIPEQVYGLTLQLIKQNQEQDGGWPHLFGCYNRVWAAIHITRFLLSKRK